MKPFFVLVGPLLDHQSIDDRLISRSGVPYDLYHVADLRIRVAECRVFPFDLRQVCFLHVVLFEYLLDALRLVEDSMLRNQVVLAYV